MASGHSSLASELRGRAPIREILDRALAGARLSDADAIALIECPDSDLDAMLAAAAELRDRGKGREVTYSRKVFLPITNLCRDRCTYCTFRKDPGDPGAWTMMPDEIAQLSRSSKHRVEAAVRTFDQRDRVGIAQAHARQRAIEDLANRRVSAQLSSER